MRTNTVQLVAYLASLATTATLAAMRVLPLEVVAVVLGAGIPGPGFWHRQPTGASVFPPPQPK